jgi:hypothetical protein
MRLRLAAVILDLSQPLHAPTRTNDAHTLPHALRCTRPCSPPAPLLHPPLSSCTRHCCPPAGWQNHPVSNSRFHFIVPAESALEDPTSLMALVEGKYRGAVPLDARWEPPAQQEGE